MKGITKLLTEDVDVKKSSSILDQIHKAVKEHEDYWFGDNQADGTTE